MPEHPINALEKMYQDHRRKNKAASTKRDTQKKDVGNVCDRMYQEFKKKNKAPKIQRHTLKKNKDEEAEAHSNDDSFCIIIPLKGNKKRDGQQMGPTSFDAEFLKAIQDEYATRYLETMGIMPTLINKEKLLKKQPLTACELQPEWNSSGWLADGIKIYPNKIKKISYENGRDEFLERKREQ